MAEAMTRGRPQILGKSLSDPEVMFDPADYYRALRHASPVHFDERMGLWLVSRYEDLREVLSDWETYSQELGYHTLWGQGHRDELIAILERDGGGYFPDVITTDPPKHGRVRKLLENAFTARRLKQLEPAFTKAVAELVEKVADRGHADGVTDFALPMTVRFMGEQIGIGEGDVDLATVKRWSDAYQAQFSMMQSREEMLENARAICELQHFVIGIVKQRQAAPGEDMISDLVRAEVDDAANPRLTFAELVALTRTFLIGGNDSISTALTSLLYHVATDPKIAEQLYAAIDDDQALGRFVEESIRRDTPVRALSRVTTREVELNGTLLPKGAQIMVLFASGNDDESVFAEPRSFDVTRRNLGHHLAFGLGIHRCVGNALARMEVKVAAREIARRLTDIRLAVPADQIVFVPSVVMVMIESLPLAFSWRG
jgi:cytochrome P450